MSWCLVRTEPRSERLAKHWLERAGLEVFLPQCQRERYSRRDHKRKEMAAYPLYPRYLFIRGIIRKTEVEAAIGVAKLFTYGDGRAQVVPEKVVEAIQLRVDPKTGFVPANRDGEPEPFWQNQPLRVNCGPYTDLRGLFVRAEGDRVRVLLKFMGGEVEHLIPERWVEARAA